MRTIDGRAWAGPVAALMLLAGCSGEKGAATKATPPPAGPVAAAPLAAPGPLVPPGPPEGADAVDAALKAAQDFDAAAAAALAGIGKAQARIHAAAGRALELAGKGASDAERPALAARVLAARNEAEAAHGGLVAGLAALKSQAAERNALVEAAVAQCALAPEFATYPGCVALSAEQAPMATNTDALTQRHAAAEAAWAAERARLDEASATLALSR
ncbi:hypothetical protein [Phenylobacterium sp.]|uniref:hypothetical protein n=1 Tax=Phenylobacterium sp. TaxID=1871053 RepID=UPI0025DDCD3A|nr:hypothetical protein [Phenylobacterium sp.]